MWTKQAIKLLTKAKQAERAGQINKNMLIDSILINVQKSEESLTINSNQIILATATITV